LRVAAFRALYYVYEVLVVTFFEVFLQSIGKVKIMQKRQNCSIVFLCLSQQYFIHRKSEMVKKGLTLNKINTTVLK